MYVMGAVVFTMDRGKKIQICIVFTYVNRRRRWVVVVLLSRNIILVIGELENGM